ncbi:MAG TPA: class I SAM-dependent methyltransferase [Spirochaetota bacterium]|nr:class I SAM-dependent methyltransferase [Spirochaetota bacterium]HQP49594.1 class I SAM-dependent methyltransferase [Spirochaetota bacterium]
MMPSRFDFDAIAVGYDSWYNSPVGERMDQQEKKAVERFLPSPDDYTRVLEVGPGTGHWTRWFSEKGFHVTGIDVSAEMISVARSKQIRNAAFIQEDFISADVRGKFDMAVAITSLEFIPDCTAALNKMKSLVRPGGIILAGVLNRYSYMGLTRIIRGGKDPVFHRAHFFSWYELKKILKTLGPSVVTGSTFALPYESLLCTAEFLDRAGSLVAPCLGNFLVGKVTV